MSAQGPQIVRLGESDAGAVLERVAASGLAERGLVTLISLRAIRERAGERWRRRREDVWSYVERKLTERLSHRDSHHRVNETDFILVMPQEDAAGAQGIALGVLEEVLEHFLGAADPLDIDVRTVTQLSGDAIACMALDTRRLIASRAGGARAAGAQPQPPAIDPREEARRNPYWFTGVGGSRLRVDFSVETVVSLKLNTTAARRISPALSVAGEKLSMPHRAVLKLADEDLATISAAVIDYAALFASAEAKTPVIAPAAFRTLATTKGRALLVGPPEARAWMRSGLMLELMDLDRGVPPGRLVEVVGLLNTLTRGVLARLPLDKAEEPPIRGARLQGVTLDATDLSGETSKDTLAMLDFAGRLRGRAPVLMAQGLPGEAFLDVARAAGFTHAALRAAAATRRSAA